MTLDKVSNIYWDKEIPVLLIDLKSLLSLHCAKTSPFVKLNLLVRMLNTYTPQILIDYSAV